MLQRYKLRLGDGTVLAVDHDGLSIWLSDRRAMVQPVGSRRWRPLKELLAQERAAARRAARLQPKPPSASREALPLVYPEPREPKPREQPASGALVAGVRADGLPLIPPPPKRGDDPGGSRRRAPASLRAAAVRPPIAKTPPFPVVRSRPTITPPPPPAPPPKPRDAGDPAPDRPAHSMPSASVEPAAAPTVVQPLAEEPASSGTAPAQAALPPDEAVEWMVLPAPGPDEPPANATISWHAPLESASASGRARLLQEAPLPARPRPPSALESLLTRWIDTLARWDWRETGRRLTSAAASAYGALLALWKSLMREEPRLPSLSPGEPVPARAVGSERSALLALPRPAGVPPGGRAATPKGTDSRDIYRPRRSPADGLPILQLEATDGEQGTDWLDASGPPRPVDEGLPTIELEPIDGEEDGGELPEIVLEPLDDEKRRPARLRAKR